MPASKESKSEKFRRLATSRVNELLKRFKSIGNLSNTSQYDYTDAQVKKMFSTIERELRVTKDKFRSAKNGGDFQL